MKAIQQTESVSAHTALTAPTLIQRSASWSLPRYLAVIGGLSALSFLLGFAALYITAPGSGVAIWWPAAGVGALIYLLYRGPRWQVLVLIGAVGFISNIAVGRPLTFAITAAVILAIELLVFVVVLGPQSRGALLSTMRGLGRFLIAVLAASVTIGIEGALTILVLVGADPIASFTALVPSHASALILIVPLALVPLPRARPSIPRRVEGIVQLAVTIAVGVIVFTPTLPVPMIFTLFPLLAWAASRFSPLFVVVELIVVAAIAPTIVVANGGPFGYAQGIDDPGWIVQLFMISAGITALFLSAVRGEREALATEKERQAAVMRGGFLGAQVGFVVLRSTPTQGMQVLEANATAAEIVARGWLPSVVGSWLDDPVDDLNHELTLPDGRSWQVFGSLVPAPGGEVIAGIQLVDVSDHVAAREAMAHVIERERAVAEELRALSRQKDDFVSAVSHELRTPITSILGFAEDLDEIASPEEHVMTEVIMRNSKRLAGMVEQLLELGRMTSPNPVRAAGSVPLNRIVDETVEEQARTAASADIAVESRLHDPDPIVVGDETSIARVVTNLLSNAIKFTPAGGSIRLTTRVGDGQAILEVDDSGVGISRADRGRVFERFYRSNDEAKLAAPGTGLGLSIVRSLVELQGGTIEIADSPLGGTRFVVRLPLADTMIAGPTPAPSPSPAPSTTATA
ncbi:MAG: ATP-binding protein [Microcella sp.]|uniref:sensor histidine kinase n=1 Tax=Microcella sp. TaxID=1913979 RepID=UPI0027278418|nr:ATP-binding protein [Microcella sp.]MDO8338726.1 ATP-binding protein [Microcella sp.]